MSSTIASVVSSPGFRALWAALRDDLAKRQRTLLASAEADAASGKSDAAVASLLRAREVSEILRKLERFPSAILTREKGETYDDRTVGVDTL